MEGGTRDTRWTKGGTQKRACLSLSLSLPHPRYWLTTLNVCNLCCYDDQPVTLNAEQWDDLVDRLNDSSRQKHVYLMKAQHRAIASEVGS